MRIEKSFLAAFLGISLLASQGCGEFSTIEQDDISVEQGNYCEQVAKVVCANVFACCTGAEIEEKLGLTITTSEHGCVRDVTLICKNKMFKYMYGISKSSIMVNDAQATACLKALLWTDQCFPVMAQIPWRGACLGDELTLAANIFMGMLGGGGSCVYAEECKKDHWCGVNRTCATLPTNGQTCKAGGLCASAFFCNGKTNKCVPRKMAGQVCQNSNQCIKKHFCGSKDPQTGEGTCKALLAKGANCQGNHECQSMKCIPGVCANTSKQCYKKADCGGTCQNNPSKNCTKNLDCGKKCAQSGKTCSGDYDCDTRTMEKCVEGTCQMGNCSGVPVCADAYGVVNYCTGPLALLLGI